MGPDIDNMTLNEYLEYEREKEEACMRNLRYRRSSTRLPPTKPVYQSPKTYTNRCYVSPHVYDEMDMDNMTIQEYERFIANHCREEIGLNNHIRREDQDSIKDEEIDTGCDDEEFGDINYEKPLTSPITPPDDNYEAPTTNPILDEFLDITVIEEDVGCDPVKDVKELEQFLSKDPLSFSMEVQVHMAVVETNEVLKPISQQQHIMSRSSKSSTNMATLNQAPQKLLQATLAPRSLTDINPCSHAFVMNEEKFNFSSTNLLDFENVKTMPMLLEWAIGMDMCEVAQRNTSNFLCKGNSECDQDYGGPGYRCRCIKDINLCAHSDHGCLRHYVDMPRNYTYSCRKGYSGDGRKVGSGCTAERSLLIEIGICKKGSMTEMKISMTSTNTRKVRTVPRLTKDYKKGNSSVELDLMKVPSYVEVRFGFKLGYVFLV
ncbi:EGF-like domain-containing protein [Artemisia annua]|uniref:EGF-like domain-containing protein n=1 Tax=Artemisia annua TaxID=35608 RepID=A0A2U1LUC2_ARTAN|nr:EGF-like domain-containing protein [Artemisia annua]